VIIFAVTESFLVIAVGLFGALAIMLSPMLKDKQLEIEGYPEPEGELILRVRGCTTRPTMPSDHPPLIGTVVALAGAGDADDQRAELWELRTDAGEVTLRDAHSSGFAVELDDGRRLVVPAGRVRIDVKPSRLKYLPLTEARLRLRMIDPRDSGSEHEPIPFQRQLARSLRDGDRVEVRTPFVESIEVDGGYRSAAEVTLTASGVPWLRPVD